MSSIICKTVQTFESLASKILPLSRLYMYPYKKIVQKEIQLAETQPKMHVLQIGAGSVPYTAMYLAQMGDLYVTDIDRDTSNIEKEYRMAFDTDISLCCIFLYCISTLGRQWIYAPSSCSFRFSFQKDRVIGDSNDPLYARIWPYYLYEGQFL